MTDPNAPAVLTLTRRAAEVAGYDDDAMFTHYGVTRVASTRPGRWTFAGPYRRLLTILTDVEDRADPLSGFDESAADRAACRRALKTYTLHVLT